MLVNSQVMYDEQQAIHAAAHMWPVIAVVCLDRRLSNLRHTANWKAAGSKKLGLNAVHLPIQRSTYASG